MEINKTILKPALSIISMLLILLMCGCAYRHYLGMHGPSIKAFPVIHKNAVSDAQCLACHHPEKSPRGPATSHPKFKGCFKCHNDNVRSQSDR